MAMVGCGPAKEHRFRPDSFLKNVFGVSIVRIYACQLSDSGLNVYSATLIIRQG